MDQTIMNFIWCKPIDLIAMLIIICGFTAMIFGVDGDVKNLVYMVVAFYFGTKVTLSNG
jgi:hypothetical protein